MADARFYVASGLENIEVARAFIERLEAFGPWACSYDWTRHGPVWAQGIDVVRLTAGREIRGVVTADVVVVLLPGGRGTHVELGAALATNKPVVLYAPADDPAHTITAQTCAFHHHRLIEHVTTLDEAARRASQLLSASCCHA